MGELEDVQVITPTVAGRETWLAEAVASVARQTYIGQIFHTVMHDRQNEGPGFVRNQLAAQKETKWLFFLDDDDLLDEHCIEWHMKAAQDQKADLVYSPCRYPPNAPWRPPIGVFDEARLRSANYIPVTVLVKREFFEKVGGFKISFPYEDWLLWLALLDVRAKFGYFPHISWTYRLHAHPWKLVS